MLGSHFKPQDLGQFLKTKQVTQQSHFWAHPPQHRGQVCKQVAAHPRTQQHYSQKLRGGSTHMSPDGRMDKQNGVHSYSGLLPNQKKEGNSDICYGWINLEDMVLNKPVL